MRTRNRVKNRPRCCYARSAEEDGHACPPSLPNFSCESSPLGIETNIAFDESREIGFKFASMYRCLERRPSPFSRRWPMSGRKRRAEAVNQWVVRNETNGEREPPALVGALKDGNPADAAGSRRRKKPGFMGVFQGFWEPVKRVNGFRSAYLPRQE